MSGGAEASAMDIINTTLAQAKDQMIKKLKWKMMGEIKKLLQDAGGNIYGGFVRDQIIHDHHADYFYEYVNSLNMSDNDINDKYNSPEFMPEHIDRCLLPSDIDCYMTTAALSQFKNVELKKKHYSMRIKSSQKASFYFAEKNNNSLLSELLHTKVTIYFNINRLLSTFLDITQIGVDMDIIHTDNNEIDMYKELSKNFDFECNALILNSNDEIQLPYSIGKYMTPYDKLKKINSIIEDIKQKKAVIIGNDTPASFRIAKMIKKGWQIEAQPFQIIKLTEAYDGYCVICHDDLEVNRLHIKDRNCDARFHLKCYLNMVRFENFKHECPLCKKYCNVTSKEQRAIEIINNMDCRENDDPENIIAIQQTIFQSPPPTLFGVPINNINVQNNINNIIRDLPPPPQIQRRRRGVIRGDMTTQEILMDHIIPSPPAQMPVRRSLFESNDLPMDAF